MDTFYRSIAGIDVHKRMLAVVVRHQVNGEVIYRERKFGTTRREIVHLVAYLSQEHVGEVVMESTAQYWRPVWYGLEDDFQLHLCHPLQTRARHGRKSDFGDAKRLADRWHSGDLVTSYIPAAEQRNWRALSRARVGLTEKLVMVRNQVEGLLEESRIKLSTVVSDAFGATGWAILQALSQGSATPTELAAMARGSLRRKQAELEEALQGDLHPALRLLLHQSLDHVSLLRHQMAEITAALNTAMLSHAATIARLCRMPGVDMVAAQDLIAEMGPNARAFETPEQFASWAGLCPGRQESAGINYSAASPKGNRYLRRLLCQIAWAAVHTKGTFFKSLFLRLKTRNGARSAAWAVAHRIGKLIWKLLHDGVEYDERGAVPQNPVTLLRKLRRLAGEFARAGLTLPATFFPQPS